MSDIEDLAYLKRRETAERELAVNATDAAARLHLEMAEHYAAEAAALIRRARPTLRAAF